MRQYGRKKICKNCIFLRKNYERKWFDFPHHHICDVDNHVVWHTKHHCDIKESFRAWIDTPDANRVNGDLVIKGEDGKYYEVNKNK